MSRWLSVIVGGVMGALSQPVFAQSASGTYAAASTEGVFLMQLVETSGGELLGRYEQVLLKPTGQLVTTNANVSGATDGRTVVLNVRPTEFLAGNTTLSGTLDGDVLRLAGGANGTTISLALLRTTEEAYRQAVALLTAESNRIFDETERRERLARLREMVAQMSTFIDGTDSLRTGFAPTEQRLRDITEYMRQALAALRSIPDDDDASVARSQIAVDINQAEIVAEQVYLDVESSRQTFEYRAGQMALAADAVAEACEKTRVETTVEPDTLASWQGECGPAMQIVPFLRVRIEELSEAFASISVLWNGLKQEHIDIVQAADAIQR